MLGLGINIVIDTGGSASSLLIRSAFDERVTEDGGTLENDACLLSALRELT